MSVFSLEAKCRSRIEKTLCKCLLMHNSMALAQNVEPLSGVMSGMSRDVLERNSQAYGGQNVRGEGLWTSTAGLAGP